MLNRFDVSQFDLSQLACRASNLAERLVILKQLAETSADQACVLGLSTADVQQVNQDLETLFPRVKVGTISEQGPFAHIKRQSMKRALCHYRWYELNLQHFAIAQQQVFLTVHAPWIQIYQQAIAQMDQSPYLQNPNLHNPDLQNPDLSEAQGLIAPLLDFPVQGCVPFLKLIETQLTAGLEQTGTVNIPPALQQRIVGSVQQIFWQRVQPMVDQAMQSAASLSFWHPFNPQDADHPITLTGLYHAFYLHFPVLARWLAQGCADLIQETQQVFARLLQDQMVLSDRFCAGIAIQQVNDCFASQPQDATEGQLVWQIELGLTDGTSKRMRYYPYSLDAERGLQKLFADVNSHQKGLQCTDRDSAVIQPEILSKTGYGYIAEPKQSSSAIALETLRQVGGNLAIQQLWGNRRGIWGQMKIGIAPYDWAVDSPCSTLEINAQMPEAQQVKNAISQGFLAVENWLYQPTHLAGPKLVHYFEAATVRLCHRPQATYLQLLQTVQAASYLSQPLAVDAIFRTLIDQPCPWDSLGEIAQLEVKMLWQYKVLWLTVPMSHRYFLYEGDHALFTKLPLSPLDYLNRRIQQMATSDQNFIDDRSNQAPENLDAEEVAESDKVHKNMNHPSDQKLGKIPNTPPKLSQYRIEQKQNLEIIQV